VMLAALTAAPVVLVVVAIVVVVLPHGASQLRLGRLGENEQRSDCASSRCRHVVGERSDAGVDERLDARGGPGTGRAGA